MTINRTRQTITEILDRITVLREIGIELSDFEEVAVCAFENLLNRRLINHAPAEDNAVTSERVLDNSQVHPFFQSMLNSISQPFTEK